MNIALRKIFSICCLSLACSLYNAGTVAALNSTVPTPKLTAITPAAPLVGPNQPLTLTGSDFQSSLTVTLIDPQGNSYDVPSADILQVKPQRVVVVATLGIAGRWKAKVTNPGGNSSEALEFAVASSPGITLTTPSVWAFGAAALIITALLAFLFIVMLRDVNRVVRDRQWSLADALSEESTYQPKEIKCKQDVIVMASSSRLIALLGLLGILTTVLGIGYSIMWNLFIYGTVPDLTEVRSFLFGAACLFAPYLANQLSAVFTPGSTRKAGDAEKSAAESSSVAISGIAPKQPVAAAAATTVRLTGSGFQNGLTLTAVDPLGASQTVSGAGIVSVDPTLLAANLTLNTPGVWKVTVANPGSAPSSAYTFTVTGPPTITGTEPAALVHNAAQQQFTLVGTGFISGLAVTLTSPHGPVPVDITSVSSTRVVVNGILAEAGGWQAVITNPGNHASPQFNLQVG